MQNTPFNVIQGDTWSFEIDYEDVDGNPINISNYSIVAEVRDKPGGSILCSSISNEDGIELINFPDKNNSIRVTFQPQQTAKFNLPKSAYQVKIVDTGDTLVNGWINVDAGVINV